MGSRPQVIQKAKVEWDGKELQGLVSVGEVPDEMGTVEVPEFDIIRPISNGQRKVPPVPMVYQVRRDGAVHNFFTSFNRNKEEHDGVIIYTDAAGVEIYRVLLQACECNKVTRPEVDHGSPTFAKISVEILPYDIIPVPAQ
jgi:hypothetical protein